VQTGSVQPAKSDKAGAQLRSVRSYRVGEAVAAVATAVAAAATAAAAAAAVIWLAQFGVCHMHVGEHYLTHKTAADFPLKCMHAVRSEVAPLLDGPYNSNDTLMLRAETGPGRNLGLILLLAAAAVGVGGLAALKAERAAFDDLRTTRSRNWIGWTKRVRRTSPLLAGLSAGRWSTVRAVLFRVNEPDEHGSGDVEPDEHEPGEVRLDEHEPGDTESAEHESAVG
jgi:hypothetical protein